MRDLVVHGHFYQPPREEPWLELVRRESAAAPDHDWNVRINRECYARLAQAPVLDEAGRIRALVNAYSWVSFDVGPTLFRWFDAHDPATGAAFVAGDRLSRERLGVGNAIAQPYHHIILPLASRRDKVTEVRWGIRDFTRRFGREPEGMWLPETAVDHETLEVLAEAGIRFTILAPHQVAQAPAWGRPGLWRSGTRELAVFVYDGAMAHDVAFSDALRDARRWHERLMHEPLASDGGPTVTSLATDGETFGHHHRHGDAALSALIDQVTRSASARFSNYGALLAAHPPTASVEVLERTAWSCTHDLGRWTGDCGCRMDHATSQAWRAPLREGLEELARTVHATVEAHWPLAAGDCWAARDAADPDLEGGGPLPTTARRLLEAERHALAMFTSCGWFFDDIARIEPPIVLRHAARAIEWLPPALQAPVRATLQARLGTAVSNDPTKGTGADLWHRDVMSEADAPARLAAGLAALRDLSPDTLDDLRLPAHDWSFEEDVIVTTHRRTGSAARWRVETVTLGILPARMHVRSLDDPARPGVLVTLDALPRPIRQLLAGIAWPMVLEATGGQDAATQLGNGVVDEAAVLATSFDGAWALVARDGLDAAGIVVHAVLDVLELEFRTVDDRARIAAFTALATLPASPQREALAARLRLVLP
jgi:hypothetical protein